MTIKLTRIVDSFRVLSYRGKQCGLKEYLGKLTATGIHKLADLLPPNVKANGTGIKIVDRWMLEIEDRKGVK